MESYSLWQMGRAADGHFSSMIPHVCPISSSVALGTIGFGMQTLSTIARFGIWYEVNRMNKLGTIQFEERRLQWFDEILEQWIAEHQEAPGLKLDVTAALCTEGHKLLQKLSDLADMDAPQVLLLKADRVAEYLDTLSTFWCLALAQLVNHSGSDSKWIIEPASSADIVETLIEETENEHSKSSSDWLKGALGIATWFIPVVGPLIGGGLVGTAIGNVFGRRTILREIGRLSEFPELLRLPIAAERLVIISTTVEEFLEKQEVESGTTLYGASHGKSEVALYLGPEYQQPWYRRLLGKRLRLRAIEAPPEEEDIEG
ncbi:MAG: hypothetical protein AB7G75_30030 [Candidatus Binatia bacterium]